MTLARRAPLTLVLAFSLALVSCVADEPIGADRQSVVVCAGAETLEGIDVSYYQGGIDWPAVAASGRAFAIARVGDGYFEDPRFDENWAGIRAAGMTRGAYQFFRPGRDATMQADIFIRKVGMLEPGDLPPVLDVEATDGQSAAVITSKIHEWVDRVQSALGRTPIIYTGKYFWNDNVMSADFADNPLWIPAYGPPCPDTPRVWSTWVMWQYSATGRVPGISGDVDLNVFNGNAADLAMLAAGGGGGFPWQAEYVAQSFPLASEGPLVLREGDDVRVSIDVRNTGTETWDTSTRLALTEPRDRRTPLESTEWFGPSRPAAVVGTVPPGATYRFEFTIHGGAVGTYTEYFGFVQEGVTWFSDSASGGGGPPDTQFQGIFQVDPAIVVPSDASVARPDAGVVPSSDAGMPLVGTGEISPGCGCRAAGASRSEPSGWWLVAAGLAATALRLRRRARP